jgi:hypothetical protein
LERLGREGSPSGEWDTKALSTAGLVAASLALVIYVSFVAHVHRIGGCGTDFPAMLRWARPGFWISLTAVLLVVTGRGKCRAWAVTAAALVLVLWIIPVWGM